MDHDGRKIPCIGCGAMVSDADGPTHEYIGATPGCWSMYGDVLGREYGEYGYPECHRLTVDAYAVQHPGQPSRRSIQSVAVHLISMHLVIEQGVSSAEATRRMRRVLQHAEPFTWLDPPPFAGALTVIDVAATSNLDEHRLMVRRWAESVWAAWRSHHRVVRDWARAMA